MAKKEVRTDLWVYDLLKQANIKLDPQGSSVKEINTALKTASKKGTGNVGFPEYVGVVKDYLLVIEDTTIVVVAGYDRLCTSQQIMDTKAKIIKHKKIDHRAPVVGA